MSSTLTLPVKIIILIFLKLLVFPSIKTKQKPKILTHNSAVEPEFSVVAECICEEKEADRCTHEQNHCSSTSYISQVQTVCFHISCALFIHKWVFNLKYKKVKVIRSNKKR